MKKLLGYLPFHFLLFLIVGIYCQFYTDYWDFGIVISLVALLILLSFGFLLRKTPVFPFLTWTTFYFLGIILVSINDERKNESYFANHLAKENRIVLTIKKVLKPGSFHDKYVVEVTQINDQSTQGLILLNVQKDTTQNGLKIDHKIYTKQNFSNIKRPLNPHQFDYKSYLAKQGIRKQLFLDSNQFLKLESNSRSLLRIIAEIRTDIQSSLKKYHFSEDEYAVINALILGQRQDISKELINDYSKAGAIHILAVSGLHVGIILLILSALLKPIERLKKGKFIKLVLMILFLWFFALIAGMSASVVRAVTMFSAVAIGQFLNKRNSIEQSLIFSMLILLLCKPMFLFDVGFQLSYLAVFGIIWIQPKLYTLWNPRFKIIDKVWQLITVSIAAQFGILPLSLFYFHQFPGLFLLSNLVIIPFLGTILILGITIIILASLSILPQFLADLYGFIISLLNDFIQFISRQEQFLFTDISFSGLMTLVFYLVIIAGMQFFQKRNANRLLLLLTSILLFQSVMMYEKFEKEKKNEFIVFHKSRNSIFGNRIGEELLVYHDLDSINIHKQSLLTNYKVGERIQEKIKKGQSNIYYQDDQQILVVDSLGVYQLDTLKNPIVILKQSPRINLRRLIIELNPKQIIADGSNYKSFINQWKQTCIKTKTPFWSTSQNGAYILK